MFFCKIFINDRCYLWIPNSIISMKNVKKIVLTAWVLSASLGSFAQEKPQNNVKLNLIPLIGKTLSLEYERAMNNSFSLNASVGYAPKGSLPFRSSISDLVESSIIDATKLGAFSLALEARFYLNKNKGMLEGFYLAPFAKNTKYSLDTQVDYEMMTVKGDIPVSGDVNAFSGGVAVGLQWIFANRLTLDWRIIGPSYGVSTGTLIGSKSLSSLEQHEVREQLHELASSLPILNLKSEVDAQGVKSTIDGPWAGIRTGLSIGYSF